MVGQNTRPGPTVEAAFRVMAHLVPLHVSRHPTRRSRDELVHVIPLLRQRVTLQHTLAHAQNERSTGGEYCAIMVSYSTSETADSSPLSSTSNHSSLSSSFSSAPAPMSAARHQASWTRTEKGSSIHSESLLFSGLMDVGRRDGRCSVGEAVSQLTADFLACSTSAHG